MQVASGTDKGRKMIGDDLDFCILANSFMSLRSLSGTFKAGLLEGEAKLVLEQGGELVGQTRGGVLHGKVVMRGRAGALLYTGRYRGGRPEGAGWLFSPTDAEGAEGGLYVQFRGGEVVSEGAVVVLPGWERAVVGRLGEGGVREGHRFALAKYGDRGCVRRIKVPRYKGPGS